MLEECSTSPDENLNAYHKEWIRRYPNGSNVMAVNPEDRNSMHQWRDIAKLEYAFAVPNIAAIEALAKLAPLIEIGAGRGYWAHLLRLQNIEIMAYDDGSWKMEGDTHQPWTNVLHGGPEKVNEHPNHTLFLCWPPMHSMALNALERYNGDHLAYVGEEDGCTGCYDFQDKLDKEWQMNECIHIPQHLGLHDALYLYTRRNK